MPVLAHYDPPEILRMILYHCCAPLPYGKGQCSREFVPTCDHQLYCSRQCAARAHKLARKANDKARRLGLPTQPRGFPSTLGAAMHAHQGMPMQPSVAPTALASILPAKATIVAPQDIANEVYRLEELDKLTAAASSQEIFEKMGYLRPGATQGVEPTRESEPSSHPRAPADRSAEPKQRVSSEDEAPDFRDTVDEADAPLDYPETDDL